MPSSVVARCKSAFLESWPFVKLAFKASLAPTFALCLTQISLFADYFGGYGYVASVAAMLALPVFSSGKFLRLLWLEVLFTCIGAVLTLLGIVCTIAVRPHPIPAHVNSTTGALEVPFNSNACVVAALFMAIQMLVVGSIRGKDPLIDYPCCCWMIVTCFGLTYAPVLADLSAGLLLVKQITTSLLVGYGLSLVAAFALFPNSCRRDLKASMVRYASAVSLTLDAYADFRGHLDEDSERRFTERLQDLSAKHLAIESRRRLALAEPMLDRVSNADLTDSCRLLRRTFAPLRGLSLVLETMQRIEAEEKPLSPSTVLSNTLNKAGVLKTSLLPKDVAASSVHDEEMDLEHISEKFDFANQYLRHCENFFLGILAQRVVEATSVAGPLHRRGMLSLMMPRLAIIEGARAILRGSLHTGAYRKLGRELLHIGESPQVAFAARMTCAVLCAALPAYFQHTQRWYISHRLVWAQYAAGLAMQASSGRSLFSFFLRLSGTAAATLISMAAWYIVVGNSAGVIILFWAIEFAILFVQFRVDERFATFSTTAAFAVITILGYQVEADKLGHARIEASGSVVQNTLLLSATRSATIAGGLLIAFVFTFVPSRKSEKQALLGQIAQCLDTIAHAHSNEQWTVARQLMGLPVADSASWALAMDRVSFSVQRIRRNFFFLRYDQVSGQTEMENRFQRIAQHIEGMVASQSAVSMAAESFCTSKPHQTDWYRDVQAVLANTVNLESSTTLLLTTTSLAVSTGRPLPKHATSTLCDLMEHGHEPSRFSEVMSLEHASEPGFEAFVVCMIAYRSLMNHLRRLLSTIEEILGEQHLCLA